MDYKRKEHPTTILFEQEQDDSFIQMKRQKEIRLKIRKEAIDKRKSEIESDLWFDNRDKYEEGYW